jgi:ParB family chromosome partitioning protein
MSKLMKTKSRLGRGLSSLISMSDLPVEAEIPTGGDAELAAPSATVEPPAAASPTEIPVDAVMPNPHQPRRQMNEASIAELAASLKTTGLIQPIIVRRSGERYELIAGERRLRAAKLAGLTTLPAIIRDVDGFTQAQMALVENIQRENLNPIDRAQAYRALMSQLGLTQAELAGRLGEDRSSIANHLRLLDLAEPVQKLILEGRLSLGHAKIIAGAPDILEQERLANLVVGQDLSVRNLERLLQERPADGSTRKPQNQTAHTADLEKSLARQLGLRVQLRTGTSKSKGRLILHYSSLDQFDELLNRLGVKVE